MGKLDRLETNFGTKFVLFVQEKDLIALKYSHSMITKDVISINRV